MRWMLIAALLALSVPVVHAADETTDDARSLIDVSAAAPGVQVGAIPAQVQVATYRFDDSQVRFSALRKERVVIKKKLPPTLLLTRTERRQMALMAAPSTAGGELSLPIYDQNDNPQGGLDQMDLHRSFSRPRLVDDPDDQLADLEAVSPYVRLRLFMARLRAVEAQAFNQIPDDGEPLSAHVSSRLQSARELALAAHLRKHS